jgi:hypothetical protein
MRAIHLLMLLLTFSAYAAEDFDDEKKALEKEFLDSNYRARTSADFSDYPNDKYIAGSKKVHEDFSLKEKKLHEKFCGLGQKDHCLKKEDFEKIDEQYRVIFGLVSRQNVWAKEGLTKEQRAEKAKLYKSCVLSKDGCDKLSEADLKVTLADSESDSPTPKRLPHVSATTPDISITPPVSKKSEEEGGISSVVEVPADVAVKAEGTKPEVTKPEDTKKEDTSAEKTEVSKPEVVKPEVPETVSVDDEKDPRNYNANTCKWISDIPRKIVNGPGCGPKSRSRICTGYVVCEQKQGGAKFVRMSSCAADKCGASDADAVKCTKDRGYYSERPGSELKLFVTPKLKEVLSGSSRQ